MLDNFAFKGINPETIKSGSTCQSLFKLDKYQVQNLLGSSKFEIYEVYHEDNSTKRLAMKIFDARDVKIDNVSFYLREKDAYTKLKNNNILEMVDTIVVSRKQNNLEEWVDVSAIVLEFAEKKDLYEYVKNTGPFDENMARMIFRQIVQGVEYIHANGYAHLDLKLDNIFLDEKFIMKIADFDLCRLASEFLKEHAGTMPYMAPEIVIYGAYDGTKADIFSLGVVLFILCAGILPFEKAALNDKWYGLFLSNSEKLWNSWSKMGVNLSAELKELLTACFSKDPNKRPSLSEIVGSRWMSAGNEDWIRYEKVFSGKYAQMK